MKMSPTFMRVVAVMSHSVGIQRRKFDQPDMGMRGEGVLGDDELVVVVVVLLILLLVLGTVLIGDREDEVGEFDGDCC